MLNHYVVYLKLIQCYMSVKKIIQRENYLEVKHLSFDKKKKKNFKAATVYSTYLQIQYITDFSTVYHLTTIIKN